MKKEGHLIHKVWNSFNNIYSQNPTAIDLAQLQKLRDSLFCPGLFYYYVVDWSLRECSYVDESVSRFYGIDPDNFSFENVLKGIHPDDLLFVEACEKTVYSFLYEFIDPIDQPFYKRIYCIRLKNHSGEYKLISHQAITLSTDEAGKTAHVLNVHTEIDHLVSTNNRKISFIGMDDRPSYFGVDPFNPQFGRDGGSNVFTKRELDIMKLLANGDSTEEIADQLCISPNTVRTHRNNILDKSDCRNMTQLISKCVREGLI